jgi:pyruvate dehydrogenase E1 component subunit alpha
MTLSETTCVSSPKTKSAAPPRRIPHPMTGSFPAKSSLPTDASPSNSEVLLTLYSVLLKTRLLEEQVLALLRAGKIPGVPVPVLGGEASEVGACIGLQPDDSFASSQPKLAAYVVCDTPLEHVFAQLFNCEDKYLAAHPSSPPGSMRVVPQTTSITGQLDIAAGIALAYRQLAKPNVVVALADDGLAALGFWHEAASLASRHRLPIVFMVENCAQSHPNGTAPVHSDEDLRDRAEAYGFPGITVDGNDIVAVWRVTQESIHRARSGAGPTLIECCTWRWHAEADRESSNGARKSKLLQARFEHDPLHHMQHYMNKRSLWKRSWKEKLAAEYRAELKRAVAAAQRLPS